MPVIRSSEHFYGRPYPLVEASYTIGWQGRTEADGGSSFVVISRSLLIGSYKVVERFPLSEDGWAGAWQALIEVSPATAEKVRARLRERADEDRFSEQQSSESSEIVALDARSLGCLRGSHCSAGT
jgi:hypothetical protein